MQTPITRAGSIAAQIESARVLDVDISTFTLTVATEFTKKPQSGIRWGSPYLHHYNGEGLHIMPEVGSICWVCFPSDGNRPFVLAWAPMGDEGDYRARRPEMNPGDIYMGTRDGNALWLRRGGVVQIAGGPLCQRLFLPINNTIRDFCENYSLATLGGELTWNVSRRPSQDGKHPSLFSILAREYADDDEPLAELLMGSHGEGDPTILSLRIKASGEAGAATKIDLKMTKEGSITFDVQKDVTWTVGGNLSLRVKGNTKAKADGKMELEAGKDMSLKAGGTMKMSANGTMELSAPLVKIGNLVNVGQGTTPVLLADPQFLALALTHTHLVTATGVNSGLPWIPTGPSTGLPFVNPTNSHIAKKLIAG